jgi:hypothetical protein
MTLIGCLPNEGEDMQPNDVVEVLPAVETIALTDYAMPIALSVHASEKDEFELSWHPSFGRLEIRKGNLLDFFVVQDSITCATKATEIESGIFEIEYVEMTDSILRYTAKIPGGDTEYHHFFASFEIDGIRYNFENNPLVEASKKQIDDMVSIVKNFSSLKNDEV